MNKEELLALAGQIATAAGQEILQVYNNSENIDVTVKTDDSPLTEADRRAHNLIVAQLQEQTPDIPVLSEESDQVSFEERRQWQRFWLVDPLDGTKEFIKRNGEFTVNIALIEGGEPTLGVVHVPVTGVTYAGVVGAGATMTGGGDSRPITCRAIQPGQSELKVVASRSHPSPELEVLLKKLQDQFQDMELVSMGSSLKICLVASGEADLYPRLGPTSEWDTAAAHAVLAAAGGKIVDPEYADLRYNSKESILNPFFTAIADSSYPWKDLLT